MLERCEVCGGALTKASFYSSRCTACGTEYIAQLAGGGYVRRYPIHKTAEEVAGYLAGLEKQREEIQAELDSLKYKPFSLRRRGELKTSLTLLDRQIRLRKGEVK